jgi:hypothetical protein
MEFDAGRIKKLEELTYSFWKNRSFDLEFK